MRYLGEIPIEKLHLDLDNPRLSQFQGRRTEGELLRELFKTAALHELAESYKANGYFSSEPVIVGDIGENGEYTVLEGNRRLATAIILTGDERAVEEGLQFSEGAVGTAAEELVALPTTQVDDPDEFNAFLGYRHISGLRVWGAGEKAKYLYDEVNRLRSEEGDATFYRIGRTVGSNARGVRSAYIAYALLAHAASEGVQAELIDYVRSQRFGVWVRLLGTANTPRYFDYDPDASTLGEVDAAIKAVDLRKLAEVLSDLRPKEGRSLAVLSDSRQVTAYSDVLAHETARKTLRQNDDLEVAYSIARAPNIAAQLRQVADRLGSIVDLLGEVDSVPPDTASVANRVARLARQVLASVNAFDSEEATEA